MVWTVVIAVTSAIVALLAIPGAFLLVLQAVRAPVRQQLAEALKDRDYYRGRVDSLEDQLRELLGGPQPERKR